MSEVSRDLERWLPVPGWETYYEVSDLGRVRSTPRVIVMKNGTPRPVRGRILRMHTLVPGGYVQVRFSRGAEAVGLLVHRLVLLAFVGEPPEGMECCHGDSVRDNNRLSNLRWGTKGDNMYDKWERRKKCPQGHTIVSPNIAPRYGPPTAGPGVSCLACKRARNNRVDDIQAGVLFDYQAVSDEHYHAIMNGLPSPRRARRKE